MDVHVHPHRHFDLTLVLLLSFVYLETVSVTDLIQFGQVNVASFALLIWTVLIILSSLVDSLCQQPNRGYLTALRIKKTYC